LVVSISVLFREAVLHRIFFSYEWRFQRLDWTIAYERNIETQSGDAAGTAAWPRKRMLLKSGARLDLTTWRQVSKHCMSVYSLLHCTRLVACITGLHVLTVWRLLGLAIRTGNLIDKGIYRIRKISNWLSKLRKICTAIYRRRAVRPSLEPRVENRGKKKYFI
jgi:hypothetical protein